MNCKICQKDTKLSFEKKILKKYVIKYFYCNNCDFLFTEEPFWLKEAYESSINKSDTGIMKRNIIDAILTTNVIFFLFKRKKTFLDYAGGYGIFTRIMRDIGLDYKWQDNYTKNILAKGFEYSDEKIELVSAFEVFEHFINPIDEINKMLNISNNILFSTELKKTGEPELNWWYYGLDHGQHTSFYSIETLQFIAKKYSLNFYTNNNIHLITAKKISKFLFKILTTNKTSLLFFIISKLFLKSKTWNDYLEVRK